MATPIFPLSVNTPLTPQFIEALSLHQALMNEQLAQGLELLDQLTRNPATPFTVALELAPLIEGARTHIGSTDLGAKLNALLISHQVLQERMPNYFEDPNFLLTKSFLDNVITPLQQQFPPASPEKIAQADEEVGKNTSPSQVDDKFPAPFQKLITEPSLDVPMEKLIDVPNDLPPQLVLPSLKVAALRDALISINASQVDPTLIDGQSPTPASKEELSKAINDLHTLLQSIGRLALMPPDKVEQLELDALEEKLSAHFKSHEDTYVSGLSNDVFEELRATLGESIAPMDMNLIDSPKSSEALKKVLESNEVPDFVIKRFIRGEDGNYFFKDRSHALAFSDLGPNLKTATNDPQVAHSMVAIASAKGWTSLKITGSKEFKSAAWLAAQMAGLTVEGYIPTEVDKALLAQSLGEVQKNSIAPGQSLGIAESNHDEVLIKDSPSRPTTSNLETGIAGRLLEYGKAPYQFDQRQGASSSYFVKITTADGVVQLHWGKELEAAVISSGASIGEEIVLRKLGKTPVEVNSPVRDAEGKLLRFEKISALRNTWEIERPSKAIAPIASTSTLAPATTDAPSSAASVTHSLPSTQAPLIKPITTLADQLSHAFATTTPEAAMEKFPELAHVYATRKLMLDEAKSDFSNPADFERAAKAIDLKLVSALANGAIPTPSIPAERYFVQIETVGERVSATTGEVEPVMQFKDAKNQIHELCGAQLMHSDFSSLQGGQTVELRRSTRTQSEIGGVESTLSSQTPVWQVISRDPSVGLHAVAAAEWVRSQGANETQAQIVANGVIKTIQAQADLGKAIAQPKIMDAKVMPLGDPAPTSTQELPSITSPSLKSDAKRVIPKNLAR